MSASLETTTTFTRPSGQVVTPVTGVEFPDGRTAHLDTQVGVRIGETRHPLHGWNAAGVLVPLTLRPYAVLDQAGKYRVFRSASQTFSGFILLDGVWVEVDVHTDLYEFHSVTWF